MKKQDPVLTVQTQILCSDLTLAQRLSPLESLEPTFEKMYDLGQTRVIPVRDLPSLHEMFTSY